MQTREPPDVGCGADADGAPLVSVVVSTYRRAHLLPRLFAALDDQTLDPASFEVVIVDNGSYDETADVLADLAAVARAPTTVLHAPVNRGRAAGRNRGWRAARGRVVAFTDDDCTPSPSWLAAGLATLGDEQRIVVGSTLPDPGQQNHFGPFSRTMRVSDVSFFPTCNVFYRRVDLENAHGFEERLRDGGEDTDLGLRIVEAGACAVFAADALVYHDVRPSRWRSSVREAWSWTDLPLVIKRHRAIRRTHLYRRVFWKRSHPPTVLALVGLAGMCAAPRRPTSALLGALALPWLRLRVGVEPLAPGRGRRLAALPGALAVDAVEVATMVRGSLRHRTLLL